MRDSVLKYSSRLKIRVILTEKKTEFFQKKAFSLSVNTLGAEGGGKERLLTEKQGESSPENNRQT